MMKMSEYGLITFLEEYIEALKKPMRFKYSNEEKIEYLKQVINLVEKQQKEIEDLKAITREYESYKVGEGNNIVIASKNWFVDGFFEEYLNKYISKDKIKAKAEELDNQQRQWIEDRTNKHTDAQIIYARDVLKELLGE